MTQPEEKDRFFAALAQTPALAEKTCFEYHESIGSTNDRARELHTVLPSDIRFAAVLAGSQSAGRGRFSRSFFSEGEGLYLSLLLRPSVLPAKYGARITGYTAVKVCEAVEALLPGLSLQIKWVNDLYLGGKKLCGILSEGAISPDGARMDRIVVGIGMNLRDRLPTELRPIATSLEENGFAVPDRAVLAAEILRRVAADYEEALPHGDYLAAYRKRMFLTGRTVTVLPNGHPAYTATVRGLDENGALLVQTDAGELRTVEAGEVSVRI